MSLFSQISGIKANDEIATKGLYINDNKDIDDFDYSDVDFCEGNDSNDIDNISFKYDNDNFDSIYGGYKLDEEESIFNDLG